MPNRISNILFFLSKLPRSAWQLLLERRALRVSRTHNWRGFSLYDYEIYSNAAPPMSQLIEALELIERLDRRRFARIRRDLRGIMVRDGGGAQFRRYTRVVVVDGSSLRHRSVGFLALVIVHEATHARLNRAGFPPWRRLRPRLERRCLKEELSFAALLEQARWGGVDRLRQAISERIREMEAAGVDRRPT